MHSKQSIGPPEKLVGETRQVTYELFRAGKAASAIAIERALTLSTIEGHLAHFIANGAIAIERVVAPEKIRIISDYFRAHGLGKLSAAKETLGDGITYGELRYVLSHLNFVNSRAVEK